MPVAGEGRGPIQGVRGAKPKLKLSKAEAEDLHRAMSAEYLRERNEAMRLKRMKAEMEGSVATL